MKVNGRKTLHLTADHLLTWHSGQAAGADFLKEMCVFVSSKHKLSPS